VSALPDDGSVRITFLRTSSLLIEYAGVVAITDPWFGNNMRGLPVFRKPGIALADLPRIDYIFASHLHRDHFDRAAVRAMANRDIEIVGTRGTAEHCRDLDVRAVHDLSPWEEVSVGPFTLHATPCEHTGPPPPEVGFVIDCGDMRLFFGGDCRWSPWFAQIAERFSDIDVAMLPVGGTLIFGKRTTMDPGDAVRASEVLKPRFVIPIHEGGEWLPVPPASWHPGRRSHFVQELSHSKSPSEACVLEPGRSATFAVGGGRID
jgi:L-ascorbate metabolism protein UlaG (beta-lactamase superfamily)